MFLSRTGQKCFARTWAEDSQTNKIINSYVHPLLGVVGSLAFSSRENALKPFSRNFGH
jgi:hypothetical protein